MPEIARFFGIIITIYLEADEPHQVSHFHVRYNEFQASYSIAPITQLAGALPRRQQRLVEAWAELHQAELEEDWQRVQFGQAPRRIRGLD
jgi:hypothetical protein